MNCSRLKYSTTCDPVRHQAVAGCHDWASSASKLCMNDRSVTVAEIDGRIECPA